MKFTLLIIGAKVYSFVQTDWKSDPLLAGYQEVGVINCKFQIGNTKILIWFPKESMRSPIEVQLHLSCGDVLRRTLNITRDSCNLLTISSQEWEGLHSIDVNIQPCDTRELQFLKYKLVGYPLGLCENVLWSICKTKPECPQRTTLREFSSCYIGISNQRITHIFAKQKFNPQLLIDQIVEVWNESQCEAHAPC